MKSFRLILFACIICFTLACNEKVAEPTSDVPVFIISTDIAIGLITTHGAQGYVPVTFNNKGENSLINAQDSDDGFTVAMALNLQRQNKLKIEAIVPIFGNAPLPGEMLVAHKIVRDLKGFDDIPIAPGANAQVGQTLQPTTLFFDGEDAPIAGPKGSFCSACSNSGVDLMYDRLNRSEVPITILAMGPLTDVACLLLNHPDIKPKIAEIILLASRMEGDSLIINDKVVNDFNFRMDPLGGTMFLHGAKDVPVKIISFALSGQTSQTGDRNMVLTKETLKGPSPATEASKKSLDWLLAATYPRDTFWTKIFGTSEGPFDQFTLVAALNPELFKNEKGLAYVQMCPNPVWGPDYVSGDTPYNAAHNPCIQHQPGENALALVPAQLIVTRNLEDKGLLVRGTTGEDGNLPHFDEPGLPVTVCTDFASDSAFQEFKQMVYDHTW